MHDLLNSRDSWLSPACSFEQNTITYALVSRLALANGRFEFETTRFETWLSVTVLSPAVTLTDKDMITTF
jgi:hypothetical protein